MLRIIKIAFLLILISSCSEDEPVVEETEILESRWEEPGQNSLIYRNDTFKINNSFVVIGFNTEYNKEEIKEVLNHNLIEYNELNISDMAYALQKSTLVKVSNQNPEQFRKDYIGMQGVVSISYVYSRIRDSNCFNYYSYSPFFSVKNLGINDDELDLLLEQTNSTVFNKNEDRIDVIINQNSMGDALQVKNVFLKNDKLFVYEKTDNKLNNWCVLKYTGYLAVACDDPCPTF